MIQKINMTCDKCKENSVLQIDHETGGCCSYKTRHICFWCLNFKCQHWWAAPNFSSVGYIRAGLYGLFWGISIPLILFTIIGMLIKIIELF